MDSNLLVTVSKGFHAKNLREAKLDGWEELDDSFGFPELNKEECKKEYCID